MLQFIHGYDLIGKEMIKIFSTAQFLSAYTLEINNLEIKEFILKSHQILKEYPHKITV